MFVYDELTFCQDTLRDIHWVETTAVQYRALQSRLTINDDDNDDDDERKQKIKRQRISQRADMHAFVLALMRQSSPQPPVPIIGASSGHIGMAVRQLLKVRGFLVCISIDKSTMLFVLYTHMNCISLIDFFIERLSSASN